MFRLVFYSEVEAGPDVLSRPSLYILYVTMTMTPGLPVTMI